MSEPREKVDISDLKDNFLECPVCVEHFNQTDRRPRLLQSCLHAFCTQCLEQLLLKGKKGQINCPLCRQTESVKGGVETLPLDALRGKLIDYAQIKHKKKCPCSDCPDGNDAESRCQECSLYLCKECAYVHKRHRLTNDHSLVPLDEVLEQPLKTFSKGHFCTHHPKHQLEIYCVTDESLCCVSCSIVEHQGHKLQRVEEAVKIKQQELESGLQKVRTYINSLKEKHQQLKARKTNIQHAQAKAKDEVSILFTKLQQMANGRMKAVMVDIDTKSSALLSSCEKNIAAMEQELAVIESTDTYYRQAKENSDAVEILQIYPSLKRCLEGSTSDAVQSEELKECHLLKFEPFFASTIEKVLHEVGHISGTDEVDADEQDARELAGFVNEVLSTAVKSKSKQELITRIFKEEERAETGSCSGRYQTGKMPPGKMVSEILPNGLPGFESFSTIKITYSIRDGLQGADHPRPGQGYTGINVQAYLPGNPEGLKVLVLLMVAWERRLTFQIVSSMFRSEDYLDFSIPHWKQHQSRNPKYLRTVQEKLADLGVTDDDIGYH